MQWLEGLDKKERRGSRPRCILLTDGNCKEVANRLTKLVSFPDVIVSPGDKWMPCGKPVHKNGSWDKTPDNEAELDKKNRLEFPDENIREKLRDWWLEVPRRAKTPTWDIASTCKIMDKPGLLLVEAKAHKNELDISAKRQPASVNSQKNHTQIGQAIKEANAGLEKLTGNTWDISRDKHYQLSNRFAWSWKLASLGIPVVLIYLGFLNAEDMANDGQLFQSKADWECVLKEHGKSVVDNSCWGRCLKLNGTPLIPLLRTLDQPFDSCA